jgi:hypothetical protein
MKRWMVIVAVLFLFTSIPVRAQEPVRIVSLRVDIWPEFDRPAVLVIYHINLDPATILPAVLTLRVPALAEVNAVAVVDPSLGLLTTNYSRTVIGNWASLVITTSSLAVQVEYYDVLHKSGNIRQIEYEWPGDVAVDALTVVFQNPAGVTNLTINPTPASSERDQYDLLNYVSETISLKAGEVFVLSAQYEKIDDELSIASMPVEPALPLENTGGQIALSDALPWILVGLGVVLLVLGALFLFGFLGKSRGRFPKKHKGKDVSLQHHKNKQSADQDIVHCHECGRRAQASDVFCRSCGTRLRREG